MAVNKKKKLILFTDGFPFGSGETFIENELPYLEKNFELIIVASTGENCLNRKLNASTKVIRFEKVQISRISMLKACASILMSKEGRQEVLYILSGTRSRKKSLVLQSVREFARSKKFFRRVLSERIFSEDEEVILYFYWNTYKIVHFVLNKKRFSKMYIVSRIHGYDLYNERNKLGRQPFKILNNKIEQLFFLSDSARKYYRENYDNNIEQYSSIARLGVFHDCHATEWKKKPYFSICSCSRVVGVKRLHLIVEALAEINDIEIEWTHYGDGSAFQEIMTLAKSKLDCKDNIKYCFVGFVNNAEIRKQYAERQYDCYMLTSESEGVPVSIMEAMSYGIPIIATSVGGVPEMLEGTSNFLLHETPKICEISQAIYTLFNMSEQQISDIRRQNYNTWNCKYNADRNYQEFVKKINNIVR